MAEHCSDNNSYNNSDNNSYNNSDISSDSVGSVQSMAKHYSDNNSDNSDNNSDINSDIYTFCYLLLVHTTNVVANDNSYLFRVLMGSTQEYPLFSGRHLYTHLWITLHLLA